MAKTRNIFASIDVNGLIKDFKDELKTHYGGVDVTSKYMSQELEDVLLKIKSGEQELKKIGYYNRSTLPSYTRLVSSKESTIGYKVTSEDYEWIDQNTGELRLNNIYNLMIAADNGDSIIWWGHSIRPNSHIQAVISDVHKVNPNKGRPEEFKNFRRRNITFNYADTVKDPDNLLEGITVQSRSAYCLECKIEAAPGAKISYDIDLMLLSVPFEYDGTNISVPIARIVVDPTIVVNG